MYYYFITMCVISFFIMKYVTDDLWGKCCKSSSWNCNYFIEDDWIMWNGVQKWEIETFYTQLATNNNEI